MRNCIQEKLNRYRRLKRRSEIEFRLESLFLEVGLLFLSASILDFLLWRAYFWELSVLKWGTFGGIILLFSIGAWRTLRALRETPRSLWETFYFLRKRHLKETEKGKTLEILPPSGNVESALDFLENPRMEPENQLRNAVIRLAEEEMNAFAPEIWLKLEKAWRILWATRSATLLLAATLGVLGFYAEENASVAVLRFIAPWKDVSWKIDFHPRWKTFSDEVIAGEAFDGEITLKTHAPYLCVALWRAKTDAEPIRITRVAPILGRYRVRIPNLQESLYLSVFTSGEATKNDNLKRVRVRTLPRLRDALARIQPPTATRREPSVSDWEITGLIGSRIGVMILADRPLIDAKIRFDNATYVPGKPVKKSEKDDASRVFMFRFELLRDCKYWLEMTDTEGLTARLETHSIRTVEDTPPSVKLSEPETGRAILPGAKIHLTLEAQDDFGLKTLGFRWVAELPTKEKRNGDEDGFITLKTRDGEPKWSGITVWETPDEERKPTPMTKKSTFTWDLEKTPLQPGMRLRLEPTATDATFQRQDARHAYFYVTTPMEMQKKTFQLWLEITREIQRIGDLFAQASDWTRKDITWENLQDLTDFLTRTLTTATRLLEDENQDGIPRRLATLERELTENPEFPFHENVSSKEKLTQTRKARELLAQLKTEYLPTVRKETVQLAKWIQMGKRNENWSESLKTLKYALEMMLEKLRPSLKAWRKEANQETVQEEFKTLKERFSEVRERLEGILNADALGTRTPMEIQLQHSAELQRAQSAFWEIRLDAGRFFMRNAEIYDAEGFSHEGRKLIFALEKTVKRLRNARFWDAQREILAVVEALRTVERCFLKSENENKIKEKLSAFSRMLASQETVLQLLEARIKAKRTHILRTERRAFCNCATFQNAASVYFSEESGNPTPRALKPAWDAVSENLAESAMEFGTLADGETTTLERMEDMLTLQLQIYDQLAELAQIVDRIPAEMEKMGKLARNSQFENRISDEKEKEKEKEDATAEITPEDVQILIAMQTLTLEGCRATAQDAEWTDARKAEEIDFYALQQRKIAENAQHLGFGKRKNTSFSNLLAQMYQVVFLLEKHDLGTLTFSIQEEILYGLRALLQQEKAPENADTTGNWTENGTETEEDLSENADAQPTGDVERDKAQGIAETTENLDEFTRLQRAVWGELPTRERERLKLRPEEKPIREYRKMLEIYYRILNEN